MEVAGGGYIYLGIALLFGVLCAFSVEHIRNKLDRAGGRNIGQNKRIGTIARQLPQQQREQANAPSLYHDPRLDTLIAESLLDAAMEYAQDKHRQAFESSNEGMAGLYRKYIERIAGLQGEAT